MSNWQPIESAPKDGTVILLSDGNSTEAGWWVPDDINYPWIFADPRFSGNTNAFAAKYATHWMPLPEPPE